VSLDFNGKTALITGGSAGIGAEFARQLHRRGCNVWLVARRAENLAALARELNRMRAGSARFDVVDLSNREDLDQLLALIPTREVDILINNAGRGSFGHFESIKLETEAELIATNVLASTLIAHAVIPQMKARRAGAILSVSSVAGFQPLPYMATYSATKAFNVVQAMALRHELRAFGIRVVTLCPGPTETEFAGVARIEGHITGSKRDPVELVVREAIRALERDRAFIVPGIRAAFMSLGSRLLPIDFTTWVCEKMLRGALPRTGDSRGNPPRRV
jgi:short-subunit dehydrogenase